MYANATIRALHAAVSAGNLQAVRQMLASGADVNAADCMQVRPVHIAAEHGHLDILKALIAWGCDVNAKACVPQTISKEIGEGMEESMRQLLSENPHIAFPVSLMFSAGLSFASYAAAESGVFAVTPLLIAAGCGHLSVVKALVFAKADVNAADNFMKISPLVMAVRRNMEDVAKFLVQSGAVVNARDSERSTPLHLAAENGNFNITELLVQNKAAINAKNLEGVTPLHVAIQNKHVAVSQFLINNGADVNAKDKNGCTPLLKAAQGGHPAETARLLIAKGADMNVRDRAGKTPMYLAAEIDFTDLVYVLIENEADVNVTDDRKWAPLHGAAYAGNLHTVKILIANGAKVDARTYNQTTPLHLAADFWHVEVVKYLLAKGAQVNALDQRKWTPLHFATDKGSSQGPAKKAGQSSAQVHYSKLNTVKALIENRADVNAKGSKDETPLHLAVKYGDSVVARRLLENGAYYNAKPQSYFGDITVSVIGGNVQSLLLATEKLFQAVKRANCAEIEKCVQRGAPINSRSIKYETPLMYASWKGHLTVVNVLLENGADSNLGNSNGVTPLHYAAKFGHHEILCVLLKHGAVYNATTKTGKKTPLNFAEEAGKTEVAETLKLIQRVFNRIRNKDNTLQKLKNIKDAEFLAIKNCKNVNNENLRQIASKNGYEELCKLLCDL